uniref:Uncharacterized protein n=1 Tax=Panagrolaimus sp. ES5 TaxID=591445 RepID=A0AC34GJX6_9BILA
NIIQSARGCVLCEVRDDELGWEFSEVGSHVCCKSSF